MISGAFSRIHHPIAGLLALAALATLGCRNDREITEAVGEMAVVVDGNNQFALDMYAVNAAEDGNLFFSPFSINTALSMLYAGAEGDTEAQIAAALGVGDEAAWHENLGALTADLCGEHHRAYSLYSANAVWGQDGVPFDPGYQTLMEESYEAPLQTLDFAADAGGAAQEINGWVEDATQGHIPELFSSGDITDYTRLVLANAIYFKADWAEQFDENDTTDRDFTLPSGDAVSVPTMDLTADMRIASLDDLKVLEMPYEEDELSMVVLLPTEDDGLADLEAQLDADGLADWIDAVHTLETHVQFPRFELETELPLMENLEALGITDAFDQGLADFTGFTDPAEVAAEWYVNAARHKAYVKVDEQGTEAAAATGFGVTDTAMPQTEVFIADHPFIFLIRDQLTGSILFMGRIEDPRG